MVDAKTSQSEDDVSTDAPVTRIALLGCGHVGSQVVRLLTERRAEVEAWAGTALELTGVAVKHPDIERSGVDPALITGDAAGLIEGADIVVEVMGGIEPARGLLLAAMERGASVVTANKALLAAHGPELYAAAAEAGVDLYFEAAVAGAIPIVRPLRESLVGDEIDSVMGIVNGTTNYILDEMTTRGLAFSDALAQAQELGYAEADPTADIEGDDAAAKAAILASLAFGAVVPGEAVHREGITMITPEDIKAAAAMGAVVKLVAVATRLDDGAVSVRVHPAMVPLGHPLAAVHGAENAVVVQARNAGRLMFLGAGAGGAPTASAVMGDLATVARNRCRGVHVPAMTVTQGGRIAAIDEAVTASFVSLVVRDEPGVLAKIATVFARHGVSVAEVRQNHSQTGRSAVLGVTTHASRDSQVTDTLSELSAMTQVVGGRIRRIRVEGS
ncbi:MAG: homoserine dehydrogenase [Propionibacteriaceae bacterium]|jgi:homoserine dehydrogenase|nr:homoserine dehydrogenase [Propionibacteriaceae bacterium]